MSVQKKPENTQRAEARETDRPKIVSLRTQLLRTASAARRVALQEQLNNVELPNGNWRISNENRAHRTHR